MISNRIKNLIFEYLLKDLIKVEIIYYRDSIWFIDRDNRYWYFEYHKVDKHLWWRWSHFTTALTMFSMEAEKEQYLLGELVNMILTKKQNLESKYPNKIFKTVGSVMNFEDNVEVVLKNEVKTTDGHGWKPRAVVDEVLNNEIERMEMHLTSRQWKVDDVLNNKVETTESFDLTSEPVVDEVLNFEVETTKRAVMDYIDEVDQVLNYEVEKTRQVSNERCVGVYEVLNNEVKTICAGAIRNTQRVDDVLNFEVEKTSHGTLIDEDKIMDEVLSVEIETIGYSKTHRARPVTGALDYNDNPVEIKSIRKLKGESPLQDVIVSHILDESDKVTDKLKIKEDDSIKSYGHDVYMCDHLVQNVLDVGVNSIHYDAEPHTQLIDGILKKV